VCCYILFPADELSLFQFTLHLVYSIAGLFTLLRMSFLLMRYHQTVCLASGVGKSSLIDPVSRVGEATGKPCHTVFGDWCVTNLVGCGRSHSHTGNGKNRHPNTWHKKSTSAETQFFVLHDFKGFERRDTETFGTVSEFIH